VPSAVVFDIGGVLIDWDPRHLYRKLLPDEQAVERFLAEVCTVEWNAEQDRGRPWADAVAELSARFPEHAALIAAYHERWDETVAGPIEETVEVLRRLGERGVPRYALTNFSVEKLRLARRRFGFLNWFDGAVVSGEEGVVKPDPRIYRILLDRFRLDPSATVYLDDVAVNVEAARAVGMIALHVTGPAQLRADLRELGLLDGSDQISCAKPRDTRTADERN
jgi:2-haloacid dehalogenase